MAERNLPSNGHRPEYLAQLSASEVSALRGWLARPNLAGFFHVLLDVPGGHRAGKRVTFEAVEGGGLLVRVEPYTASVPSADRDASERPRSSDCLCGHRRGLHHDDRQESSICLSFRCWCTAFRADPGGQR